MYEDSLLDFLYTNRISYERMVFVNPKFHVNRVPGPCNAGTSSWVDHLTTSAQVNVPIFRQQLSYSFRSHICCKKAIHYTQSMHTPLYTHTHTQPAIALRSGSKYDRGLCGL